MQHENETESVEEPQLEPQPQLGSQPQLEPQPEPQQQDAADDPLVVDDDVAGVVKSTVTMSMATMLSRITGFVRTWACAFALGNTVLASAYQVANNMPNMIFELVAGGIITTAFLPVFVSTLKTRGKDGASYYASNLMCIAAIGLAVIALLATVFAPQVVWT